MEKNRHRLTWIRFRMPLRANLSSVTCGGYLPLQNLGWVLTQAPERELSSLHEFMLHPHFLLETYLNELVHSYIGEPDFFNWLMPAVEVLAEADLIAGAYVLDQELYKSAKRDASNYEHGELILDVSEKLISIYTRLLWWSAKPQREQARLHSFARWLVDHTASMSKMMLPSHAVGAITSELLRIAQRMLKLKPFLIQKNLLSSELYFLYLVKLHLESPSSYSIPFSEEELNKIYIESFLRDQLEQFHILLWMAAIVMEDNHFRSLGTTQLLLSLLGAGRRCYVQLNLKRDILSSIELKKFFDFPDRMLPTLQQRSYEPNITLSSCNKAGYALLHQIKFCSLSEFLEHRRGNDWQQAAIRAVCKTLTELIGCIHAWREQNCPKDLLGNAWGFFDLQSYNCEIKGCECNQKIENLLKIYEPKLFEEALKTSVLDMEGETEEIVKKCVRETTIKEISTDGYL